MKAAIDIGTNTALLLVAEILEGNIEVLHEEQRTPRLGKGVDSDGVINSDATERVIQALNDYREIIESEYKAVDDIVVTATSAVRDAKNRNDFLQTVKEKTGFHIRLLSGKEEADWTATGALLMLSLAYMDEYLILDIGGGSTELALVKETKVTDAHSFDIGSVRFTERFLKDNPPTVQEIKRCRDEINHTFESRTFDVSANTKAIGVAGTVTSLASLLLGHKTYNPSALNNYHISSNQLSDMISVFSSQKSEELLKMSPGILRGREDILLAGLLILEGFLHHYNFDEILVSTGGIRHGALVKANHSD